MDGIYNLRDWVKLSAQKVLEDDIVATIHIDELESYGQTKHLIDSLRKLLEEMSLILAELNTAGLSIYLSVDLLPRSINPSRFVNNPTWIEQEVLPRSVPEIIIYKPADPELIPSTELHRTPLTKNSFGLKGDFNPFYKEGRTLADIQNRVKLSRELLFIYEKPRNSQKMLS
jgi:hypothetical protein